VKRKGKASSPQNRARTGKSGFNPAIGAATRFKPGVSGNPGGRPSYRALTEALEQELTTSAEGGITKHQAVARCLVELAIIGDVQAMKLIFERLEGKPPQALTVDGDMRHEVSSPQRVKALISAALGREARG
jgi:hypothetical protein